MAWWDWILGRNYDSEPTQEELLQQPIDQEVLGFGLEDEGMEDEMGVTITEEMGVMTQAPEGWWNRFRRWLS